MVSFMSGELCIFKIKPEVHQYMLFLPYEIRAFLFLPYERGYGEKNKELSIAWDVKVKGARRNILEKQVDD